MNNEKRLIKKICFFGVFDPSYARNKVLAMGLIRHGYEVVYCNTEIRGFKKYLDLARKLFSCKNTIDFILVPFPGKVPLLIAKFLSRKTIILDSLVSVYDSNVFDRQVVKPYNLRALFYWLLDYITCKLADVVLCDTEEHIKYFIKTFSISRSKFIKILVGSDESDFNYDSNQADSQRNFLVHFHGTFIPLQGIEYIVQVAKLLENENITFNIIGRGQTYKSIRDEAEKLNLQNINFIDPVPYEELKKYICQAAISLGIFGNTNKARRVIPNKVYEALSVGIPIITGDSPAIREVLTDRDNVLLVKMADGRELADKILELKNDTELRKKIGQNGLLFYKKELVPEVIVNDLVLFLNKLV